jgi:hypothetical protein
MPKAAKVRVDIYNIVGQKVTTLLNDFKQAGYHVINFNASGLASGIYFYRIQSGKFTEIRKMVLMQ